MNACGTYRHLKLARPKLLWDGLAVGGTHLPSQLSRELPEILGHG